MERWAVWLTLIPVLLSMWMIFVFSAQPAEQSNQTSGRLVELAIRLFVPDYEQLAEPRQAEITHLTTLIVRKTAHAVEYALLGFFLRLHIAAWSRRPRRPAETGSVPHWRLRAPGWVWSLLIGCLYAVTDELHQGFVAERAPRIADVGVDTAGVMIGIAACGAMLMIVRRLRKGKSTSRPCFR